MGTLVVSLPSVHTGGELVIDHAGESRTYRASREDLTLVAFYSDCRHEVTPVRSGYRVTLTFDLLAGAGTPAPGAGPVTELAGCLTEHFATPAIRRFGARDVDPPNRLVFLLDHEYTQRGLAWRRLKGVDAERAALLRAVAERAGCEAVLALAEVKQTWDVEPSGGYGWAVVPAGRGRRGARDRAFAARAEAGSQWALHELRDRIEAGELVWARAAAESLAPFWLRTAPQAGLLDAALDVAAGLNAAGTAAMLLEPFRVETLTQEHAAGLAAAAERYGPEWTRDVINGWFGQRRQYETDRHERVEGLPGLCEALRVAGRPEVAWLLPAGTWRWLHDELRAWITTARTDIRQPQLEQLSSPLTWLIEAADDSLREEISAALHGCGDRVLECLMPTLRPVASRRSEGFDEIARDCAQRLAAILAQPRREDDDWSVAWARVRVRPVRHAGYVPRLADTAGLRMAARERRTPPRAHPDRFSRPAGTTPDPTTGPAIHTCADENRRAVHPRHDRAAHCGGRLGAADRDLG